MTLYHFSEASDISDFVPRPPLERPEVESLVWTVTAEHAWTYLFPRDCPRVLLWKTPETTIADWRGWAGANDSGRVACVEWAWFERMASQRLYRYNLPPVSFRAVPGDQWMFVSTEAVRPSAVDEVPDLMAALRADGVELRFLPSLRPLRGAWESTVHFSGIRLRNAVDWE